MPNYFAHLTFGAQCLDRLPRELRARLERERSAFDLGCLGPDPLFFYRVGRPNAVRREGMTMHAKSAMPAFERLRAALEEGLPMASGYAAGFLCHLALDHACHKWVDQQAAAGPVTHLAMEAEFDRLLLERAGLVSLGKSYMPEPPEAAVFTAAARAYVKPSPEQVEEGYRSMCRDTALFARLSGHRLSRPVNHVVGTLPALRALRGVFLTADSHSRYAKSNAFLTRRLADTVPEAANQIVRLFRAVETGAALDPWLDRDFKGLLPREEFHGFPTSAPAY